jgi:O-antigen/teichoic acid export membrane protein
MSTKLIGLILLPLYTDYLTTADYGILSIFEITSQFLTAILGFRMSGAMMRWLAVEKDKVQKKNILLNTYLSVFVIVVVFLGLTYPFGKDFSFLFFGHGRFESYFTILVFWIAFDVINHVNLDLIRIQEKSVFFIILTIVKFVTILLLSIYFVAGLEWGVKGVILAQAIGNLLIMLAALPFALWRMWGGRFSFPLFREMAAYGFPLIFSTISMMLLTLSDRYVLKYLAGDSAVGIYSLGYKIAGVINLFVIQSFQLGFLPIAYKMFDQPGAKRFYSKVLTYLVFILFMTAFVVSFFSKEVIMLFASREGYWIAYSVVPFLSLGFIFRGVNFMFSLGLHYVKKTRYNAYIVSTAALLNIGMNFLLIPYLGIYGAAITTVLSNYAMVQLFYIFSQKFYPIRFEFNRIFILFGTGILMLGGVLAIDSLLPWLWWVILLKVVLIIFYPFVLYMFNFFEPIEIDRLKGSWKKWRNPSQFFKTLTHLEK